MPTEEHNPPSGEAIAVEAWQPNGPYLAAAVLCDSILRELDDVVSIIRIHDSFHIESSTPELPPGTIQVNAFIHFKAGGATGQYDVAVQVVSPKGVAREAIHSTIAFDSARSGSNSGAVIDCNLFIRIEETGVYWIQVFLADRFVTAIPLAVHYHQVQQPDQPQG